MHVARISWFMVSCQEKLISGKIDALQSQIGGGCGGCDGSGEQSNDF